MGHSWALAFSKGKAGKRSRPQLCKYKPDIHPGKRSHAWVLLAAKDAFNFLKFKQL